jgi:methylthioribose-1-phosphate isomerase
VSPTHSPSFRTIQYRPGVVVLIDQTKLPREEVYVELVTVEEVARAIETMVVRGAPAIGVTAAFGIALAARHGTKLEEADARLRRTRPTAVNLFYGLDRMKRIWSTGSASRAAEVLEAEAQKIYDEDVAASVRIGELGEKQIPDGASILTHCNAGALATAELGTALAVIRAAHRAGKKIRVYADETRPLLQGARLTAWELMKDGIDVTLIPDVAVAHLLGEQKIDCAVVGADRIARNGDTANKIGTRGVACMLYQHGRPLYIAAPFTTVDMTIATGRQIPIEERAAHEVTTIGGVEIAPKGIKVRNPAFDVTPASWISGIITDRGFTGKDIAAGLEAQSNSRA